MLSILQASQRERAAVAAFGSLPKNLQARIRKDTAAQVVPWMRAGAARAASSPLEQRLAATARYTAYRGIPGVSFGGPRAVTSTGVPGRVLARPVEFGSSGTRRATYQARGATVTRRVTRQFMPDTAFQGRFVQPAAEAVSDDVTDLWVGLVEDAMVAAWNGESSG
jgi:hypothetical protein